jgi:DNA polymerase-3 subunit epsilon
MALPDRNGCGVEIAVDDVLREIARRLAIDRPLAFLDLETTGVNPDLDRIVEVALRVAAPGGRITSFHSLVNPGVPIPSGASAVHHITDADVRDAPRFAGIAPTLFELLRDADLAGFGIRRFDMRLLAREFERVGFCFAPEMRRVVDALSIFHKHEPRDLTAAMRYYCDLQHNGHRAEDDVAASIVVLAAQLDRYRELPSTISDLDGYCVGRAPDWLTSDGKVVYRDGKARLTFGKHGGRALEEIAEDDPSYLEWMIRDTFAPDVKAHVASALKKTTLHSATESAAAS